MTLNDYVKEAHRANSKWWLDLTNPCEACRGGKQDIDGGCVYCGGTGYNKLENRNVGELLMLCVSELAEAMEGHRKSLMDDKLPHRKMFDVEVADCMIRLFDLCGGLGVDLETVYREKMAYNSQRIDHTIAHRLLAEGKKY